MLRRFCSSGWGALNATETAAVEQLCASHRRLLRCGGLADIGDEATYAACTDFLGDIDRAARALSLETASRGYRAKFSANYRALFPDNARLYRVDLLETSLDQHSAIWVNGEKFELSPEALRHAEALRNGWFALGALLDRWDAARHSEDPSLGTEATLSSRLASRDELHAAFVALDVAWANFERTYIGELIAIEEQARQLLVRAVQCEAQLRELEKATPQRAPWDLAATEGKLVKYIGQLNSVANFKCKGRDDLGYDILQSARDVIKRCDAERQAGSCGLPSDAARVLATDVISSYHAMRTYLTEVGTCLERVDPHLCNNAGLAARLVDWETSWEVGARYVRQAPLLEGICDVVAEVKLSQTMFAELITMFEDCDVELFLVLPRLVMLFFAVGATERRAELVKSLLPHRFQDATLGPELAELCEHGHKAFRALGALALRHMGASEGLVQGGKPGAAWEVLVKRAVLGGDQVSNHSGANCAPSETRNLASQVVEDLMRELERWSLELQRHCPQDWNQCSSVLVQCVTGRMKKQPSLGGKFQV